MRTECNQDLELIGLLCSLVENLHNANMLNQSQVIEKELDFAEQILQGFRANLLQNGEQLRFSSTFYQSALNQLAAGYY